MITFQHIEDYLEVLGGYREISASGKTPGPINIFGTGTKVISLARYDVNIVTSMATQTSSTGSLTDRQAELAIKLVDKYKRQFASHGVDVLPSVQNPQFRHPVRVIDRSKIVAIAQDKITVKFPYDKVMVPEITAASKESLGKFKFNRDMKFWELALTEHNINWAVSFGTKHGFNIDQAVLDYMDLILDVEQQGYKIELCFDGSKIYISNAAESLVNYVQNQLGGFEPGNLLKLVDYAPVLGYVVQPDVVAAVTKEYDPIVAGLLANKESHVLRMDPNSDGRDLLESAVQYCKLADRWPLCIYEPDTSLRLRKTLETMFEPNEIVDIADRRKNLEVDLAQAKIVYFSKIKRSWHKRIPILVSTNAMLYGGEKQAMLQVAEKVVYYTATTYNKEATQIAGNTDN